MTTPPELNAELCAMLDEIEGLRFECAAGPLDMHPTWHRIRLWAYYNELMQGRMTTRDIKADEDRRFALLYTLPPSESQPQ